MDGIVQWGESAQRGVGMRLPPPTTTTTGHIHDSTRPSWLTAALGLKIEMSDAANAAITQI